MKTEVNTWPTFLYELAPYDNMMKHAVYILQNAHHDALDVIRAYLGARDSSLMCPRHNGTSSRRLLRARAATELAQSLDSKALAHLETPS